MTAKTDEQPALWTEPEPPAPVFESYLAADVLAQADRSRKRAERADRPEGTRRAWGTVPPVMHDKLRAGLLAHLRELIGDLELIKDLIRDFDQDEGARAKHTEAALLGLVGDYEEAVNIASDWRQVAG